MPVTVRCLWMRTDGSVAVLPDGSGGRYPTARANRSHRRLCGTSILTVSAELSRATLRGLCVPRASRSGVRRRAPRPYSWSRQNGRSNVLCTSCVQRGAARLGLTMRTIGRLCEAQVCHTGGVEGRTVGFFGCRGCCPLIQNGNSRSTMSGSTMRDDID